MRASLITAIVFVFTVRTFAGNNSPQYVSTHHPMKNLHLLAEAGGGIYSVSDTKQLIGGYINIGGLYIQNEIGVIGEINIRRAAAPAKQLEAGAGYALYSYDNMLVMDDLGDYVKSEGNYDYYEKLGTYYVKEHNDVFVRGGYLSSVADLFYDATNESSQGGKYNGTYIGAGILSRINTTTSKSGVSEVSMELGTLDLLLGSTDVMEKDAAGALSVVRKSQIGFRGSYLWGFDSGISIKMDGGYLTRYVFVSVAFGYTLGL